MTVDELLGRMSSAELSEWQAYYELEPFGQVRGDLQAGMVAAMMGNLWRGRGKFGKPYGPGEFVLRFEDPSPGDLTPGPSPKGEGGRKGGRQSAEEMKGVLAGIFGKGRATKNVA